MRKTLLVTLLALIVGVPSVCAQDNPGAARPPAQAAENPGQDGATLGTAKPFVLVNAFVTTKEVVWPTT